MQWGHASDEQLSHHAYDPKDYRQYGQIKTSMIRLLELCFLGDPAAKLVSQQHVNKTREIHIGTVVTSFTQDSPYHAQGSIAEQRKRVRALEPPPVSE